MEGALLPAALGADVGGRAGASDRMREYHQPAAGAGREARERVRGTRGDWRGAEPAIPPGAGGDRPAVRGGSGGRRRGCLVGRAGGGGLVCRRFTPDPDRSAMGLAGSRLYGGPVLAEIR